MSKQDRNVNLIIAAIFLVVLIYVVTANLLIDTNRIYVIAKVKEKNYDPEQGPVFVYEYIFQNKVYKDSYTSFNCGNANYMVVKISKSFPSLNKVVDECAVPVCLQRDECRYLTWDNFPKCP